jgi:4-diphosphocytidyl-2-C-methyl-D-erythritol kinase
MQIDIEAPAKINVFLKVLGRRPDGYHDLLSVMQKLTLCDSLCIKRGGSSGIRLRCEGADLPENEDNLVYRAAALFMERVAVRGGVEIVLTKKIPVAAGLGGGSSDAAAVLRGLTMLFDGPLAMSVLLEMAVRLGADVPFFIEKYDTALATGIGDRLQPLVSRRHYWVVLANPGFPVSTKWAYDNFALTSKVIPFNLPPDLSAFEDIAHRLASGDIILHNDLERVTCARYPEIDAMKALLLNQGATGAMMSGSGPTVFALFRDQAGAEAAAGFVRLALGANVYVTRYKGHQA